jgi:hypothetical protein
MPFFYLVKGCFIVGQPLVLLIRRIAMASGRPGARIHIRAVFFSEELIRQ